MRCRETNSSVTLNMAPLERRFEDYQNLKYLVFDASRFSRQRNEIPRAYEDCLKEKSATCVGRKERQKKSVSFAPNARQKYIRHLNDYSKAHLNELWYSEIELKKIKEEVNSHVALLNEDDSCTKSSIVSKPDFCFAGIESRTAERAAERLFRRQRVWDVVFEEQKSQSEFLLNDPQSLADLSAAYSKPSVDLALTDAEHIRREVDSQNLVL